MYIHFKPDVYERLKFLATREEISVAAFVARQMEELAIGKVSVEYSLKEEEDRGLEVTPPEYTGVLNMILPKSEPKLVSMEIKGSVGQSPT